MSQQFNKHSFTKVLHICPMIESRQGMSLTQRTAEQRAQSVATAVHTNGQEPVAETRDHLTAVARMYYLDGMAQSEIADLYQISRSTVSRMLSAAREQGIVRISIDEYDPRCKSLEAELKSTFGLQRAVVIRSIPGQVVATRREIAHHASAEVGGWISRGKRVGVTGGRTLGELVRSIPHSFDREGIGIYQLMGAVATTPGINEPGEITRALGNRLNGKVHMLNIPAYVSDPGARASMAQHDQVQAMWRMFQRLHMTFVGIGSIDNSMFVEHGVVTRPVQRELRNKGAVAEVCGRFVDANGTEIDHPLRNRVMSIELDVLKSIPDVVAVSSGTGRGAAVHAVLANTLATSAVLDSVCAESVLEHRHAVRTGSKV